MTPDVNVLVAAFRPGHVHHPAAQAWLRDIRRECAAGSASVMLISIVVAGFLRLATNPRVFTPPDRPELAVAFIDALLATPGIALRDGDAWPLLRSKLLALNLGGNAINDAWIAAAVEVAGEQLVTFDRGFRRLLAARHLILLPPG